MTRENASDTEPPGCITCTHYVLGSFGVEHHKNGTVMEGRVRRCTHPKAARTERGFDVINGRWSYSGYEACIAMREDTEKCGPSGSWYEMDPFIRLMRRIRTVLGKPFGAFKKEKPEEWKGA